MRSPRVLATERLNDTLVIVLLCDADSPAWDSLHDELQAVQKELGQPGLRNLVVDFGQAAYFDSTLLEGIGALARQLRAAGGKLAMCNLSPFGREIVRLVKFDAMWPVCAGRVEAVHLVREAGCGEP